MRMPHCNIDWIILKLFEKVILIAYSCTTSRMMPGFKQLQQKGGAAAADDLHDSLRYYRESASSLQSLGEGVEFRLAQNLTETVCGLYLFPTGRSACWMSLLCETSFSQLPPDHNQDDGHSSQLIHAAGSIL